MKITQANGVALLWGFAEASFFFIVPDVFLSWRALSSLRRALIDCLLAVIGALVGGTLVWLWAINDPDTIRSMFAGIPAINETMMADVRAQLADTGIFALFMGPLIGIPYKIYALEAADLGIGLLTFLALSIPARLIRFVIVTVVVGIIGQLLQRKFSLNRVRMAHLACWSLFYIWYFWVMST
jgi:uncharacterized membrane protein YeaQ/YmgE (transglycosylase-associated protein family)